MKRFQWWWLLLLVPIIAGLARLHFDVEMLDLLPADVPAVQGLKIYQQHFTDARELIVTVRAPNRDYAEQAARAIAENLQHATGLVANVTWQPPWQEHPEQTAELIAYLWLNQPPEKFAQLAARLSGTNLTAVLAATRDLLATTLSPNEIAQSSYDPFGLTRLPEDVAGTVSGFGSGDEMFASADGTFRIIFVKARDPLNGYQRRKKPHQHPVTGR
jgi:predicted RND superfamily exporter protein